MSSDPKQPDSVATQADALRKVQFQKLRSDGLKIQSDAQAAFGRGETDLAIQMLVDYANRVRAANLEPSSVALLLRPIESRLEMFRVMKGQTDAIARVNKETRDARDLIAGRGAAEEQRKTEVASLVRQYHAARQEAATSPRPRRSRCRPSNSTRTTRRSAALPEMAKMSTPRHATPSRSRPSSEKFVLEGLNNAEQHRAVRRHRQPGDGPARGVAAGQATAGRATTTTCGPARPAEYDIELKLDKPISIEFNQTPLEPGDRQPAGGDQAAARRSIRPALDAEGISAVQADHREARPADRRRHLLAFTLEQAGLSYVVENDLVKVTTTQEGEGPALHQGVLGGRPGDADPELRPAGLRELREDDRNGLAATAAHPGHGRRRPVRARGRAGRRRRRPAPRPGQLATTPGISGGTPFAVRAVGSMRSGNRPARWVRPPRSSASGTPSTSSSSSSSPSMIRPYSWDGMGGPGKVEFFDIGSALVVNQTADVIQEVAGPAGSAPPAAGPGGRRRDPHRLAVRVVVRADGRGLLDEHQDPHAVEPAHQFDPNTDRPACSGPSRSSTTSTPRA